MAAPQVRASRVLALLRHSTNAQDNARQKADIEKLKKRFGIDVVEMVALEGVSGRKVQANPAFLKLIKDLRWRSDVDGLALSAIDRFFRTDKYGDTGLFQPLVDGRKLIWSVREGEVDPSTDEGFTTCMAAALKSGAEWRELRARTMGGKDTIAEAGHLPHGTAWYGVEIIGRRKTGVIGEGRAVILEPEAAVVREVFAAYRSGKSAYSIAMDLNQRGILSKGHNGKPPALWSRRTILQMLEREEYIGTHRWGDKLIEVPRIIDDETFYAVQAMKQATKKRWVGRPSTIYLLRGYAFCARCKHRMRGTRKHGGKNRVYRCGHVTNKPPIQRLCPAGSIPADLFEETAFSTLWSVLREPKLLLKMGHAHHARPSANQSRVTALQKELTRLRQRERNMDAQIEDAESNEALLRYRAQRTEIRTQIALRETELREAAKVMNFPTESEVAEYLREITSAPEPQDYASRRAIMSKIIDLRVTYDDVEHELAVSGLIQVATPDVPQAGGKNWEGSEYASPNSHPRSYDPIPFLRKVRVA